MLFGYSAYMGMEKGIKVLSNINFWGAMGLLAFILLAGPTIFMLETGLDSLGLYAEQLFRHGDMGGTVRRIRIVQEHALPSGLDHFLLGMVAGLQRRAWVLVARISRGRTIKQMVVGSIFFGSMGCFLFFMILGNYGLSLQLSGKLDIVGMLQTDGAYQAIFAILDQLPFSSVVIAAFTTLCLIFTATTFDSISYILASVVQNNVTEEPMRWNRLFWAFTLSIMPSILLFMGGLATLQTAAIVGGLPLLIIAVMLMLSAVRAASLDLAHQEGYESPEINIEVLPEVDPWSREGVGPCPLRAAQGSGHGRCGGGTECVGCRLSVKEVHPFSCARQGE